MLAYIRRNAIAFIALFMSMIAIGGATAYAANTIRSGDIVDGQVQNADIADNAIGTHKINDNSIWGVDIKESTLSRVPDAAALGGVPANGLKHRTTTNIQRTSACVQSGTLSACAPVAITVPNGHFYAVTVFSSVTALVGANALTAQFCPAASGPTCMTAEPDTVTFWANGATSAAGSATAYFGSGNYTFSSAVNFSGPVVASNAAHATTTVEIYDFAAEGIGG